MKKSSGSVFGGTFCSDHWSFVNLRDHLHSQLAKCKLSSSSSPSSMPWPWPSAAAVLSSSWSPLAEGGSSTSVTSLLPAQIRPPCPAAFVHTSYNKTTSLPLYVKTYPKLIIKPYRIISFCKLHLPLPQVVEGVVDPGKNKLGSRVGRSTLARLNLPPSWSHCCRRQMVRRRSRRRLSSTLCPAQVLPLYPGLQR